MYIIHPSVWVKLFTKLVKTSASDKFWSEKLIFLEDANRIHLLLGFDLELPNYVIQFVYNPSLQILFLKKKINKTKSKGKREIFPSSASLLLLIGSDSFS